MRKQRLRVESDQHCTVLAPPLQGRGWGGASPWAFRLRKRPTPGPSPEGEGWAELIVFDSSRSWVRGAALA
ncbi:hypothetical protein BSZ14_18400 [Sphingomonas sp. Sph1(2015)]|nr:hypothetical protein BSZ14_18400 [Sphingomonas sp. Sph1(2015)]